MRNFEPGWTQNQRAIFERFIKTGTIEHRTCSGLQVLEPTQRHHFVQSNQSNLRAEGVGPAVYLASQFNPTQARWSRHTNPLRVKDQYENRSRNIGHVGE